MKDINTWKLKAVDITAAASALKQFVADVVAQSLPFKMEVEFVKAYSEYAVIKVAGEQCYINKSYCYFSIHGTEPGEKVFVDNRYIHKTW